MKGQVAMNCIALRRHTSRSFNSRNSYPYLFSKLKFISQILIPVKTIHSSFRSNWIHTKEDNFICVQCCLVLCFNLLALIRSCGFYSLEREITAIEKVMSYMKSLGLRPLELLRAFDKSAMINVSQKEFKTRLKVTFYLMKSNLHTLLPKIVNKSFSMII